MAIRKFKERDIRAHSKGTQTTQEWRRWLNDFSREMAPGLRQGNRGLGGLDNVPGRENSTWCLVGSSVSLGSERSQVWLQGTQEGQK